MYQVLAIVTPLSICVMCRWNKSQLDERLKSVSVSLCRCVTMEATRSTESICSSSVVLTCVTPTVFLSPLPQIGVSFAVHC